MITLLRTLSLGYFRQHLTRTALVVLSIALGVAILVATQALSKSLGGGIQDGVNPLNKLVDLLIVNGQVGVPMSLGDEVRAAGIEGVADAQPQVMWRVSLRDLDKRSAWLLGLDTKAIAKPLSSDNDLGIKVTDLWKPATLAEAASLLVAQPSLVSKKLADDLAKANPDSRTFAIRNAGFTPELTRVATVDLAESKLPLKQSQVIFTDVRTAAAICFPEKPDHVHQIGITLTPNADPKTVRDALQKYLGDRADVQTLDVSRQLVSDVTAGLEIGLAIGGAGALVVGLFLVYNALSVSVAERRHDIGILRSVGATRWQITWLFMHEATVMGLFGSLVGLPMGWLLAWGAAGPMAHVISDLLVPIDSARVHLPVWLMGVAVASGTVVAILASLVPALQAASEEPAEAVRRVPRSATSALYIIAQLVAIGLFLLVGLLMARFRDDLPPRFGMFAGIVCLLLGGLLSTPLLTAVLSRFIKPFFQFLGLEGRLAADNLVRTPGRTGLVIAALAATGGLLVQTAGFVKSTREAVHDWINDKIAADLFVTSGSSLTSGGSALQMQHDMRAKVEAIPGVVVAMPIRFQRVDYTSPGDGQKRIVFVVALDTKTFREKDVNVPLAKNLNRYSELGLGQPGTVVVSENFASLHKVKIGEHISFPGGRQKLITAKVIATVVDYTWNRGTIIMDMDWFRREYNDNQVDVFDVFLTPGTDPAEVRKVLMERHGEESMLFAVTRPEVNSEVTSVLNKIYGLAYAQQMVVGLVALLGVTSALFISVLQRRRELGLLRAVGATRGQILRSVLAEAVLMGLIGSMIGFGVGLLLEWYVLDVMIFDESGFRFALRVPWLEAGVVTLGSVLLATLAGLWPAYQATMLRIPDAIAYE